MLIADVPRTQIADYFGTSRSLLGPGPEYVSNQHSVLSDGPQSNPETFATAVLLRQTTGIVPGR